eukprot:9456485-Pyramimonas_sp.AAC.1
MSEEGVQQVDSDTDEEEDSSPSPPGPEDPPPGDDPEPRVPPGTGGLSEPRLDRETQNEVHKLHANLGHPRHE